MKRLALLALLGPALFAAWLSSADTGTTQSDPDLVVIYLSGWRSSLTKPADVLNTWKTIEGTVEAAAPGRVLAVPYSYTYRRASYESPPTYTQKDTNQSLDASADALSNELADLGSRYPRARFLLVGHSLGGVVASYWAGKTPSSAMQRIAGVVTFDSPVEGVVWTDVYRALLLANVVTGNVGEAVGLAVLRGLFDQALGDGGPVIDQLDKTKTPETFKTVEKAVANLAAAGGNVHNGFECWDLLIICRDAQTPGADLKEFKLRAFADCRTVVTQMNVAHVGNRALAPDFSDPVEAGGSAKLEPAKAKKCYTEMHGRVLQVPEAGTWVASIAKASLAATRVTNPSPSVTPPPSINIPPGFEQYRDLVQRFQRALTTKDRALLRETLAPNLTVAPFGGPPRDGISVAASDANLAALLNVGLSPVRIAQVGPSCVEYCGPAYGLIVSGWRPLKLDGEGLNFQNTTAVFEDDVQMLVFRAEGRGGETRFFGVSRGPFLPPDLSFESASRPQPAPAPSVSVPFPIGQFSGLLSDLRTALEKRDTTSFRSLFTPTRDNRQGISFCPYGGAGTCGVILTTDDNLRTLLSGSVTIVGIARRQDPLCPACTADYGVLTKGWKGKRLAIDSAIGGVVGDRMLESDELLLVLWRDDSRQADMQGRFWGIARLADHIEVLGPVP